MSSTKDKAVDAVWDAGQRVFVPFVRYGSVVLLSLSIILCTVVAGAIGAEGAATGFRLAASEYALRAIKAGLPLYGIGTGFIGLLILPMSEKVFILLLMIIAALITKSVT